MLGEIVVDLLALEALEGVWVRLGGSALWIGTAFANNSCRNCANNEWDEGCALHSGCKSKVWLERYNKVVVLWDEGTDELAQYL